MTSSPGPLPPVGAAEDGVTDRDLSGGTGSRSGPPVGASDADADAVRAGGDVDLDDATRDSDGVPVGEADADADARRAAAADARRAAGGDQG